MFKYWLNERRCIQIDINIMQFYLENNAIVFSPEDRDESKKKKEKNTRKLG